MKTIKNNDLEETIDLVIVEKSNKPDYQGALDRLKSIDLDYVSRVLNQEQLENISDYSIHDYPRLEMMGDIETLQKLVDKATLKKPLNIKDENLKEVGGKSRYGSFITGSCPKCKRDVQLGMKYCPECGQTLDWMVEE